MYLSGGKIPKRDKLGIYARLEDAILESLTLCIKAAYTPPQRKMPFLEEARISIELSKQILRLANEIRVIEDRTYLHFSASFQEASKMVNGWISYLIKMSETQNPPRTKSMGGL